MFSSGLPKNMKSSDSVLPHRLDSDEFQGYYFGRPLSPEDFNNKYFMKDNDVL